MAWVLSTVQKISLEEGAPELPGFFVGQAESSPALTLVFEDTKTAQECAKCDEAHPRQGRGHESARLSPATSRRARLPWQRSPRAGDANSPAPSLAWPYSPQRALRASRAGQKAISWGQPRFTAD